MGILATRTYQNVSECGLVTSNPPKAQVTAGGNGFPVPGAARGDRADASESGERDICELCLVESLSALSALSVLLAF